MVTTRSMSRNLKRKREEMDNYNYTDEQKDQSIPPKQPDGNPRKRRKLNSNNNSNNNNIDNKENVNKNIKKAKKAKKAKKTKKTKKTTKSTNNMEKEQKEKEQENEKENKNKVIHKLKEKHRNLLSSGYKYIIGVDEAGRGPLAGPVVVSAAYVPININIDGINDSKKINDENEREKLYEIITSHKEIKYSIAILNHEIIDEYNILEASMMGMRECATKLHDKMDNGIDYILVDGNRDPKFIYPSNINYEYIIKGDGKIYCIGAASIIAKVTRDRIMAKYHKMYPIYNFISNKGYPTPSHKNIVITKGPCEIHRKTFKPVKDWYKQHKPDIYEKVDKLKKQRAEERKNKNKKDKQDKKDKDGNKSKEQPSILSFFGNKKKNVDKKKKKKKNANKKKLEKEIK